MAAAKAIFHNTIGIADLASTRHFYGDVLGCTSARRGNDTQSVDYDFFGNHIVCHLVEGAEAEADRRHNQAVDPLHQHFGLVQAWDDFTALTERLRDHGIRFLEGPDVRYAGEPREETLCKVRDPSGYVLEFKAFRDLDVLFGRAPSSDPPEQPLSPGRAIEAAVGQAMPTQRDIFHKTVTVFDLEETRFFYGDLLGCPTARRRDHRTSCDFDFFGNHLVCHLAVGDEAAEDRAYLAQADYRHQHFGLVIDWDAWEALVARLKQRATAFMVEPLLRYVGDPNEEALFMLRDPSGHPVEFKAFRQLDYLYRARN